MPENIGPDTRPPLSSELFAAGRIIGYKCYDANLNYLKCKNRDENPAACLPEGEATHKCVYDLFNEIRAKAPRQFAELSACLEWEDLQLDRCKAKQHACEAAYYAAN